MAWRGQLPSQTAPSPQVGYIEFNGVPFHSAFRPGLDIRVPPTSSHQCGPACGMGGRLDRGKLDTIAALSPWTRSGRSADEDRKRFFAGQRRRYRFFWSGLSRPPTGSQGPPERSQG